MAFSCFRAGSVPSKKAIILSLEGSRERLEQDNARLKLRVDQLQQAADKAAAERQRTANLCKDLQESLLRSTQHAAASHTQLERMRQDIGAVSHLSSSSATAATGAAAAPATPVAATAIGTKPPPLSPQSSTGGIATGGGGATAAAAAATASAHDLADMHSAASNTVTVHVGRKSLTPDDLHYDELEDLDDDMDPEQARRRTFEPEHPSGRLQGSLDRLARELAGLLTSHRQLHSDLLSSRAAGEDLKQQLSEAQQQRDTALGDGKTLAELAQLRCSALETENVGQTEIIRHLEEQLAAAQLEQTSVRSLHHLDSGKLVGVSAMLAAETNERMALQDELKVAQQALEAAEQESASRTAQLTELLAVRVQYNEAATLLTEANCEVVTLRAEVEAGRLAVAASALALSNARSALTPLQERVHLAEASAAASSAEVLALQASLAARQGELTSRGTELARAQRSLQDVSQRLDIAEKQLSETTARLATTQQALHDAQAAHLGTRQQLAAVSKQLAATAAEMGCTLGTTRLTQDELHVTKQRLTEAMSVSSLSRDMSISATSKAATLESANSALDAELRALTVSHDRVAAELERKRMLLMAIARIANKGKVAKDEESLSHYKAALAEDGLVVKLCEAPLGLLSSMAAGIMDSHQLNRLKLDMETPQDNTWEKAGLRIACLAAALSLNGSLEHLELTGSTWDELGNGSASPFLMLSGPASALTTVRIDTRLFDLESATVLRDLLIQGLIELKRDKKQGVLRLYSQGERLNEWYTTMIRRSVPLVPSSSSARRFNPSHAPSLAYSSRGASHAGGGGTSLVGFSPNTSVMMDSQATATTEMMSPRGERHPDSFLSCVSNASSFTTAATGPGGGVAAANGGGGGSPFSQQQLLPPPPLSPARSYASLPDKGHHKSSGSYQSSYGSFNDRPAAAVPPSHSRSASNAASVHSASDAHGLLHGGGNGGSGGYASSVMSGSTNATAAAAAAANSGAAAAVAFVDCDLSNEGLESHHMVLVMAVLLVCPHLRRLKLDGNQIGDPGAEILALALPHNSSLLDLSLSRNGIHAKGARRLCRGLESNAALKRLDISGQRFGGLGPQGAEAFAAVLRVNTTLEELNLSSSALGPAGAAALAAALRSGVAAGSGAGGLRRLLVGDNKLDAGSLKLLQAAAVDRKVMISS